MSTLSPSPVLPGAEATKRDPTWLGCATVLGPPGTKGSARGFVNKRTGRVVITNDNPRGKTWQQALTEEMRACAPDRPFKEPVVFAVRFYLARPASHFGTGRNRYLLKPTAPPRPTGTPDWDKVARLASDAATGVWIADDSYIVEGSAAKHYAASNEQPRTEVECWLWIGATP